MAALKRLRAVGPPAAWCALAAFALTVAPVHAAEPPLAIVATLAGSGEPGSADGPAMRASFLMPAAVTDDARGDVYVADAAGQRIRELTPDGQVRTVAGGGDLLSGLRYVAQGDRDGARGEAQFFNPSGIAAAPDGTLFVADTNNGAIRRISATGAVSTWVRGLGQPRQLALDHAGNVYVADAKRGLLRITPDGVVSKLDVDVDSPFGVAIVDEGPRVVAFVADARGITQFLVGGNVVIWYPSTATATQAHVPIDARASIGTPFQLAAIDDHAVAYTDLRAHCVRYLDLLHNITFVLAGSGDEAANIDGAGFVDGSSTAARFDDPMGIAFRPDGSLVVADAGNRRIRVIRGFDHREVRNDPVDVFADRRVPGQYRILYVGSSNVWWATSWSDSIPGIVERTIANDVRERTHRTATVVPLQITGAPLTAFASYAAAIVEAGATDAVVLQVNDGALDRNRPNWIAETATQLRKLHATLTAAHVPLVLVDEPLAFELDAIERTWSRTLEDAYLPANLTAASDWQAIAAASGVPMIDLWAPFNADLASAHHVALYGSDDEHFSSRGRELSGHTVGSGLLQLHPWRSSP